MKNKIIEANINTIQYGNLDYLIKDLNYQLIMENLMGNSTYNQLMKISDDMLIDQQRINDYLACKPSYTIERGYPLNLKW